MSKGMRRSYDANFKTVVIKYAEQTTVKQQESTVSARETSEGGNNRNKNLMSILHENLSAA
jgi:hypothetical protein